MVKVGFSDEFHIGVLLAERLVLGCVPRISALEDDTLLTDAVIGAIERERPEAGVQLHSPVFAEDNRDGLSIDVHRRNLRRRFTSREGAGSAGIGGY
jgi:hypothetical protein